MYEALYAVSFKGFIAPLTNLLMAIETPFSDGQCENSTHLGSKSITWYNCGSLNDNKS